MYKRARPQKSITIDRKREILNDVDQGNLTKTQIAAKYDIPKSTLSTIIKNKSRIDSAIASGSVCKLRVRGAAHQDLEDALLKWFKHMRASQIPLSGPMIKSKAREICTQLGIQNFTCSDGWLWRFQRRHSISSHVLCGEANKVNEEGVNGWLQHFESKRSSYMDKDIFNFDETGVFFNLLPNHSLDFKGFKCHGGANSKERLTVALCCNADGSEKHRLWVIGKSQNPRCLKNFNRLHLPCDYTHQRQAWIDSTAFREWLIRLQRKMATQNRKILLTLDNYAAHKVDGLDLPNVEVIFFPPNVTSRIQPLDQGIIHCMKSTYRNRPVKAAILNIEAKQKILKWNVLQAMRAISIAWDSVSPETIKNCFRKAWRRTNGEQEEPSYEEERPNDPEVWISNRDLLLIPPELNFSDFVNIDNCVSICAASELEIEKNPEYVSVDEKEDNEKDEEELKIPSRQEVMKALSVIQRLADTTEVDSEFITCMDKITKKCDKYTQTFKQSRIDDFFKHRV